MTVTLPGQNVAIQTTGGQIEPIWYEKLKIIERLINAGTGGGGGGIPEAPTDGSTYGRKSLSWSRVLDLAGGTLTGPLVLAADPTSTLGAATKHYVDTHGASIGNVVAGGTPGSVLFIGTSGVLAQDNANFFWDDTNHSLNLSGTPALFKVPNATSDNWFVGGAGNFTVTGFGNFGMGPDVLINLTTGRDNIGIGGPTNITDFAATNITVGVQNVAIGASALTALASGNNNIAIGTQSLYSLSSTASGNVAIGAQALKALGSSGFNVAIGLQALALQTSGIFNTCVGSSAADEFLTGDFNAFIGAGAGDTFTSGSNNVFLGSWDGSPINTFSNAIVISDGGNSVLFQDWNLLTSNVWSFQNNSASPVGLHVYNTCNADTHIPLTNYERAIFDWNVIPNVLTIGTQTGTGVTAGSPIGLLLALTYSSGGGVGRDIIFVGGTVTFPPAAIIETNSTVAALPAAGKSGRRSFVTDAIATTFAVIVAGSGTNHVPVYDDGTNWRIG